ncbi:MAG: hypothetical protein GF315_09975 [candidate division Zixibacteria bacterium]|nr:hypothetical protein [candidate division Zixibacteria bacterium]
MRKYLLKIAICILITLLTSGYIIAGDVTGDELKINIREYRFMLKPAKFENRRKAARQLWQMVRSYAAINGVSVFQKDRMLFEKQQELVFLDTENRDIYRKGYLLYKITDAARGRKKNRYDLILQRGYTDLQAAWNADFRDNVSPKAQIILQEELRPDSVYTNNFRPFYLMKNVAEDLTTSIGKKLGDYAKIFPVLSELNIPADSELKPVNDLVYMELVYSPGVFNFGDGIKSELNISVMYEWDKRGAIVGELFFRREITDYDNVAADAYKCNEFFGKLAGELQDWILYGFSKAEFTYEHSSSESPAQK